MVISGLLLQGQLSCSTVESTVQALNKCNGLSKPWRKLLMNVILSFLLVGVPYISLNFEVNASLDLGQQATADDLA